MSTDLAPAPVWDRTTSELTDAVNGVLQDWGLADRVLVGPLGHTDHAGDLPAEAADGVRLLHLYGHQLIVGPRADDRGPCPVCLTRRWQGVRSAILRDALELGTDVTSVGENPATGAFAAALVASVVARQGEQDSAVVLIDLRSHELHPVGLIADPECPRCGELPTDAPGTGIGGPAPKRAPTNFRLRSIGQYPLDLRTWANPVTGVVGNAVMPDQVSLTTASTLGHFTTRSGEYLRETYWGGHADRYGDSARIGVLEGLERYAGMRARARRTSVRGSLNEQIASGTPHVDPRDVGLYSDEFYAANPRVTPFHPDRDIPWVWGHSLRDDRPVLVPEVLTYYSTPGLENRFVQESSNGCASGGSPVEAAYFGLMEIVERDAFMLMWFNRADLPEIDPRTSASAATRTMVDRLSMYGYTARFFDARITFPIPVVVGVAVRSDGRLGSVCFGGGASLDPEAALSAALCEVATDSVKLADRADRDGVALQAMAHDHDLVTSLHDHPLMYGFPQMLSHTDFLLRSGRPVSSLDETYRPGPAGHRTARIEPSDDLGQDLRSCVSSIAAHGFDVVTVDQTLPEQAALGLHTVSVLVPGLLPIDFGWRRQRGPLLPRTRTALRRAGLRATDPTPDQLNPTPHPFP